MTVVFTIGLVFVVFDLNKILRRLGIQSQGYKLSYGDSLLQYTQRPLLFILELNKILVVSVRNPAKTSNRLYLGELGDASDLCNPHVFCFASRVRWDQVDLGH